MGQQHLWTAHMKSKTYTATTGTLSLATEFGAKARLLMFRVVAPATAGQTADLSIYQNGIAVGTSGPLCSMTATQPEGRTFIGSSLDPHGNTKVAAAGGKGQLYMPFPCGGYVDSLLGVLDPVFVVTIGTGGSGSVTIFYTDDQ